jgi:hypothetical protein
MVKDSADAVSTDKGESVDAQVIKIFKGESVMF